VNREGNATVDGKSSKGVVNRSPVWNRKPMGRVGDWSGNFVGVDSDISTCQNQLLSPSILPPKRVRPLNKVVFHPLLHLIQRWGKEPVLLVDRQSDGWEQS
jgi:hypothetical protein